MNGDDTISHTPKSPSTVRSTRHTLALRLWAALMIVLIAAVAVGAWQVNQLRQDRQRTHQVLEVARQVAADLVTVGSEDPEADVERILSGTTGELRQEFSDVADAFTTALGHGAVSAEGTVPSAAVVEVGEDQATVIAAVIAVVSNTDTPDGQRRAYRMQLTVDKTDAGWVVSKMEVLP